MSDEKPRIHHVDMTHVLLANARTAVVDFAKAHNIDDINAMDTVALCRMLQDAGADLDTLEAAALVGTSPNMGWNNR